MLVVSNTSPLSNLALIGRLELLREQVGSVHIPPAVRAEIARHPHPDSRQRLDQAFQAGWIKVVTLGSPVPPDLQATLDLGEAEALALALESKATLVLLDESAARLQARRLGLAHTGVLGVLLKARQTGRLPSLREAIQQLRQGARFFVHPSLERQLLITANED